MRRSIAAALLFSCMFAVRAFAAEDCTLHRVASLDMGFDPNGRMTIPMSISGKPLTMLVDSGGAISLLGANVVKDLDLSTDRLPFGFSVEMFGGTRLTSVVHAREVALANLRASQLTFVVLPAGYLPAGVDGILGPDILSAYDTELDFANDKFNLYQKHPCEGKVVYWTHDAYAVVPFVLNEDNHIVIDANVDGKPFRATVDTGASSSVMNLEAAKDAFDIADSDPNLKSSPDGKVYSYPFKALTLDGVTVKNPAFALIPNSVSKIRERPKIILGMGALRQLHIYIAYGEKNLYITSATAH